MANPLCGNCAEAPPLAGRKLCAACASWMDKMLEPETLSVIARKLEEEARGRV